MDPAMTQRLFEHTMTQRALHSLSGDDPWRQPLDAWRQLDAQCRRAARGEDDGFNALTVPL
jgi:hypothetical protein